MAPDSHIKKVKMIVMFILADVNDRTAYPHAIINSFIRSGALLSKRLLNVFFWQNLPIVNTKPLFVAFLKSVLHLPLECSNRLGL